MRRSRRSFPAQPHRPGDHLFRDLVGATVLLGHGGAQEAVLAGLAPDGAIDVALLFPLGMERRNFLLDETTETVAKGFMLGAENGSLDHAVTFSTKCGIYAKRSLGEKNILHS